MFILNKIVPARKAFEAFLKRYPFCYGYWKKFADMERKSDEIDRAREVFEKGVQEIALSVDLWVHYLNFTSQMSKEQPNCAETMRNLFERAISAAGEDFRSDKLWEAYIEWEKSQKQLQKVTALYDRVLAVPTLNYSKHWTKFQEHINSNPLEEVVIPEELLKLKAELGAAPPGFTVDNEAPVAPPLGGEVDVNGMAVTSEVPESEGSESVDPETRAVRKKIIAQRQALHSANEGEVSKRWTFEEGIKRPYFHVKPLEKMQLKNWRDYLDFEVSTGNHRRVVILFERCVIACAMYEEFWQKFASYMEMHDCLEGVQHVYERACNVHLPKKPRIHLAWAALEEKHGNVLKARDILANLDNAVPGLVHVKLCRVNFERRCNDFQNACAIYEQAIAECSDTQLISFYSVKYSRFLTKITKNYEKAKEVLKAALDKDKDSRRLYLQLLDVEMSMPKMNEDEIDKIFELVKSSSLTDDVKESFSQRRLEFLEDHSNSIVKIMKAQEAHEKLYKNTSQSLTGRKRASDNGSETDAKVAKTDDSSNSIQYNHTDYGTTDYSSATGYSTATTAYNYSTAQWPGYGTSQPQGYNYGNWYQQYGNTYA
ncbi:pre-mRNA-processing factor 39-like isoform X2 [Xenia sp. Carnegie-2017]|uniref:pre-mRNA-processing factor 39-like isoform X2 n=1 Tax=Xenia sp. Carnegie-2017 TaxID=2897299 RepID=UPI001F035FD5|nr:pre-mRNA-processing factor 39-like isoform X2 [Xenia sp. Carnegie-2017]